MIESIISKMIFEEVALHPFATPMMMYPTYLALNIHIIINTRNSVYK